MDALGRVDLLPEYEKAFAPAYAKLVAGEPLQCAESGTVHPVLPHPRAAILDVRSPLLK